MSQLLIQQYLNHLQDLRKVSGTHRESVVREAFKDLLKGWARSHDLIFVPEYEIAAPTKERRYVDGALLHGLRVPFGYWEAKDEKDDLDTEIALKLRRGYPQDNIIFEDSTEAVLIQAKTEVMRSPVDDVVALEKLLRLFFGYARPEVAQFRKAVEQFKADLPAVLEALREMIERAHEANAQFRQAALAFLAHAQETINPNLTAADVREMLIQHVLTEEIFAAVFPGTPFHQDNNVARELYRLEATFFTGNTKFQTLKGLETYYVAIRAAAAQIATHHEKQSFLKVIYEGFYKVYNPKAADRLGVVYTPNEIVRFMIESADWLCEKHFGRNLIDKDVEILDPATGTGTFVCELLEHFRGQPAKLKHKYREELHANEVAILPYYVANLNIEATYAAITGEYEEYPNLCFVDTLDNVGEHTATIGTQMGIFGSVTEENVARIRRQNSRKISVVIGNPPYNANQLNENEDNKNREYPEIDARIKATYIAKSAAQKTKLYDMYARFLRYASDRLAGKGVVSFVSNRSFIDKPTFDGFRKCAAAEFNEIWIVDLKGDARTSGERRRRQGGSVFDDQIRVGVAVYFLVRSSASRGCRIFYESVRDYAKAEEKREFLSVTALSERSFREIRPDADGNWINQARNGFNTLLPLASKATKASKRAAEETSIFKLFSLGVSTNRDEWVLGFDAAGIAERMRFFLRRYEQARVKRSWLDDTIKWSRNLKRRLEQGRSEAFDPSRFRTTAYRPFCRKVLYDSHLFIDERGSLDQMFPLGATNVAICFSDVGSRTDYVVLAVASAADLHFGAAVDAYQQVPQFSFDDSGRRHDNITDWAQQEFHRRYGGATDRKVPLISKQAIFQYVYGVLHDPLYREKYALNLDHEFPRIPFYSDFWQWADWGKTLIDLHLGYETVEPWSLERHDLLDEKSRRAGLAPKALLKVDKEAGGITLDSETTLSGVPAEVWDYQLGNRSALEWVLDQHKERKPKDPTIRAQFDTYRFADHKEKVIDLLARVTTVSVATVRITREMRAAKR